jgi:Fic family protein
MESLHDSPVGTTQRITGHDPRFGEDYDVEAFVPHDLPKAIDLSSAAWMIVTEAAQELGRLDAAAELIPRPEMIARMATRREAIGTSALEGTYADLTELLAAEVSPSDEPGRPIAPNVREVMNYTEAADSAYLAVVDQPISMGLLSALQSIVVRDTTSDGPEAGAVRERPVFIGAPNRRVGEARFVPPPHGDELRAMCERWIEWLTDPEVTAHIPVVARLAMAHYQFETIHPYTDGNGRLGRLVAVLQLLREGTLRSPVLAISPWLEERKDEYRDHLLTVSMTGDWDPWVMFFAQAVRDEARSGHVRIARLLDLRTELVARVRAERPRAALALEIAEMLIAYPLLTVAAAQQRHGRSNQANRDAVAALVHAGVLQLMGEARYDQLYWCPEVLQAVNA